MQALKGKIAADPKALKPLVEPLPAEEPPPAASEPLAS